MSTKIKTIRVSEEDLMKIELILISQKINFNNFINRCIAREIKLNELDEEKIIFKNNITQDQELEIDAKDESKRITFKANNLIIQRLKRSAKKRGFTLSKEVRFRVLATLYDDVYDSLELKKLKVFLNEIKKIGRFFNISIQENILIKSDFVQTVNQRLNGVEVVLKNIINNNRIRNINY